MYGKSVGDMIVTDPAPTVYTDGKVVGTFKPVTGYTGFSDNPAEQSGYYFPFTLSGNGVGTTMTFKKNGVDNPEKTDIPWEANNVFRVTQSDTFTILIDGHEYVTLNFADSTFQEAAKGVATRSSVQSNAAANKNTTTKKV